MKKKTLKLAFASPLLVGAVAITAGAVLFLTSCGNNEEWASINDDPNPYLVNVDVPYDTTYDADLCLCTSAIDEEYIPNCEYSINGGQTWHNVTFSRESERPNWIHIPNGKRLQIRGDNPDGWNKSDPETHLTDPMKYKGFSYFKFRPTKANINLSGNIMGLLNNGSSDPEDTKTIPDEWCFSYLFANNNDITVVDKNFLPATILKAYCYDHLFANCYSLEVAPNLPATDLTAGYKDLQLNRIKENNSLAKSKIINDYRVNSNPNDNVAITIESSPGGRILKSEFEVDSGTAFGEIKQQLTTKCIEPMMEQYTFSKWTNKNGQPITDDYQITEPLTMVANFNYQIIDAEYCYANMFESCQGREFVLPKIEAEVLSKGCFEAMFLHCTRMTLPGSDGFVIKAKDMKPFCCEKMFTTCKFDEIDLNKMFANVETLAPGCFSWMFRENDTLTKIKGSFGSQPAGSTKQVHNWDMSKAEQCCEQMFDNCINLGSIQKGETELPVNKNMFENISKLGYRCFANMFSKCNFVAKENSETNEITNTLPLLPHMVEGKQTLKLAEECYAGIFNTDNDPPYGGNLNLQDLTGYNIETDNTQLAKNCFVDMFSNSLSLRKVPKGFLPTKTLAEGCYGLMFHYCTQLQEFPDLPATTLAKNCYYKMFEFAQIDCEKIPTLNHVQNLADGCFDSMYRDTLCINGEKIPSDLLPGEDTQLTKNCYKQMFDGCQGLAKVPALPATTLAESCYESMFRACGDIDGTNKIILPATTLVKGCYDNMFENAIKKGNGAKIEVHFNTFITESDDIIGTYNWLEGAGLVEGNEFYCPSELWTWLQDPLHRLSSTVPPLAEWDLIEI